MFPEIANWRDWGRVYDDAGLFRPLIEDILRKHSFPLADIEKLTPGTNAVFAMGDIVAKLFAPKESGVDPAPTYRAELDAMMAAAAAGVPAPTVLATGVHTVRYDFYYIITRRVRAMDAKEILPGMDQEARIAFARRVREVVDKLHALSVTPDVGDIYDRARENPRWEPSGLPDSFRNEAVRMIDSIEALYGGDAVFVHGDLTDENVLLGGDGELHIIDFADACRAPALYELAPLYFDLFGCDTPMLKEYMPGHHAWDLVEPLVQSLCLHDFGPSIIADFICPKSDIPVSQITSVNALRGAVARLMR